MALTVQQGFEYQGSDWWRWWVWVEGSDEELDAVEFVVYTLHPTFPEPVRKVTDRASKFRLTTAGWGTFTIFVTVHLANGEEEYLEHSLQLAYPPQPADRGFSPM